MPVKKFCLLLSALLMTLPIFGIGIDTKSYDLFDSLKIDLSKKNLVSAEKKYLLLMERNRANFLVQLADVAFAEIEFKEKKYEDAQRRLNRVLAEKPFAKYQWSAVILQIKLYLAQSEEKKALNMYKYLLMYFPEKDTQETLFQDIQALFPIPISKIDCFQNDNDFKLYAERLIKNRQYTQAVDQTKLYLNKVKNAQNKPYFLYLIGIAYYLGDYNKEASTWVSQSLRFLSKNHDIYPNALLLSFKIYERMQDDAKALKIASELVHKFENTDNGARYYYHLCNALKTQGNLSEFEKNLETFKKKYAQSPWFKRYLWETNIITLKKENNTLKPSFISLFSNSKKAEKILHFYQKQSAFWKKSLSEAMEMFPLRYETKTLLDGQPVNNSTLEPISKKEWEELAYLDFDYRVVRNIGPKKDALLGMSMAGSAYYSDYETIDVMIEATSHWLIQEKQIPQNMLKALYPTPYEKEVRQFSKEYQLDPFLVFAIMRETSQFLFSSFDYKEERSGVFKLKIKTGKEIALRIGDYWKDGSDLLNPQKSIQYTCFYLNWLNQKSNHNLYLTLATFYTDTPSLGIYSQNMKNFTQASQEIKNQEIMRYIQQVLDSYLVYSVLYEKS